MVLLLIGVAAIVGHPGSRRNTHRNQVAAWRTRCTTGFQYSLSTISIIFGGNMRLRTAAATVFATAIPRLTSGQPF
jgi:hypothetical protein